MVPPGPASARGPISGRSKFITGSRTRASYKSSFSNIHSARDSRVQCRDLFRCRGERNAMCDDVIVATQKIRFEFGTMHSCKLIIFPNLPISRPRRASRPISRSRKSSPTRRAWGKRAVQTRNRQRGSPISSRCGSPLQCNMSRGKNGDTRRAASTPPRAS